MLIREQKAIIGGGLVAAVAAVGIFAMVAGGDADDAAPAAQATPVAQPVPQNTVTEREQQLARMIANDRAYIGNQGYRITDTVPRAKGRCAEDATITQSGWHGGDTGLLYQAEKGGAFFTVCFSHDNEAVTRARAMPLNPEPPPSSGPSQIDQDAAMLERMIATNRAYLGDRGYEIVGDYEALGNCEDRGARGVFNDNAGWQGANTGILYTIKDDDGDRYWACVSHNNGRVIDVTAAPK